jgi:hypothetical protein
MHDEKKKIEEKFILDYFKFAININLYGVAPYIKVVEDLSIESPDGEKIVVNDEILKIMAINTHRFLYESYENLAQFLRALIERKDKDIPIHEYLGKINSDKSKDIPHKSKNEHFDTFLEHHGLPIHENEIAIKTPPKPFIVIKTYLAKRIPKLLKAISTVQDIHSDIYNTTKHSKSWVSSAKEFMGDPMAPDSPMALIIKDGKIFTKWISIPYDKEKILQDIYLIQGVAATLRDLTLLFAMKHYPEAAKGMLSSEEPHILDKEFDKGAEK